eukprot:m.16561 g.16561  ORF g.16561 m.16561 type:complete len:385 (-) comp5732_c0_seq1:44-1198(-)
MFRLLLPMLLLASLSSAKFLNVEDTPIQVVGRVTKMTDGNGHSGFAYDHPGTRFVVTVKGTTFLNATMERVGSVGNNYIVFVNGKMVPGPANTTFCTDTMPVNTSFSVQLASGLDASTEYTIELFKSSEAQFNGRQVIPNYETLWGFEGDSQIQMSSPPALPSRRLAFLGDSITAGYCNLCTGSGVHQEAFHSSWANQICDLLDAQCHTVAWSGFGMVRNCCGGSTLASDVWWRTLATVPSPDKNDPHGTTSANLWNFSSFIPDGIVINLGTNDHLPEGDSDPVVAEFNATYLGLIRNTSAFYKAAGGKVPTYFLACGPMSSQYCNEIMYVMQTLAPEIKAVFLDQRPFLDGKYGPACCGHPSAMVDTAMALNGSAFIKETLGW